MKFDLHAFWSNQLLHVVNHSFHNFGTVQAPTGCPWASYQKFVFGIFADIHTAQLLLPAPANVEG